MSTSNQNSVLTKSGAVILVFTIIFSMIFIIAGAVNLSNDNSPSGSSNTSTTYRAYDGSTLSIASTSGKYYDVEFSPNYSGTYSINMNGATVSNITNSSGNTVTFNTKYGSYYDHSYTVYLSSSYTYTFKIYATSSYITFLADY